MSAESERIHDILQRTWARELSADEALEELKFPIVPRGWKLVPVEPTEAVLEAGCSAFVKAFGTRGNSLKDCIRITCKAMNEAETTPNGETP